MVPYEAQVLPGNIRLELGSRNKVSAGEGKIPVDWEDFLREGDIIREDLNREHGAGTSDKRGT